MFAPGFGFGAVVVEDGVGGVEDEFEAGDFLKEFEGEGPAHAAVVHAVFVDGLDAVVAEELDDVAEFAEAVFGALVGVFAGADGVAHDADEFRAEALHAGDAAFGFGEGLFVGVFDFFAPVGDGGAEAADVDAGGVEFLNGDVKGGVGDVVEVGFGIAGDFDAAHFDIGPAEFLDGGYLAVDGIGGFVADSGEVHGWSLAGVEDWIEEISEDCERSFFGV